MVQVERATSHSLRQGMLHFLTSPYIWQHGELPLPKSSKKFCLRFFPIIVADYTLSSVSSCLLSCEEKRELSSLLHQPIPCECLMFMICFYFPFIALNFGLDRGSPIILKGLTNGVYLLEWLLDCEFWSKFNLTTIEFCSVEISMGQ